MTRADYDKFLQMYGIPPSDEKYEEYKKSITNQLVNKQMTKLMSEVKQPIKKPTYPDMIIGPDTATGNKERMDFYNKQMKEYNLQTKMLQEIKQGFKDKLAYYNQQEKLEREKQEKAKRTKTVPVSKDKQQQVDKVNDKLKNLTPQEREMYNIIRKSQEDKIKLYDKRQKEANQHNDTNKPKSKPSNTKIKRFQLNNPTEYLAGQLRVENNKQGHSSLAQGQSIEQHNDTHSKNFVNHIDNKSKPVAGQIPNVKYPPHIVIHAFDKPTPHNVHSVESHSLNKEAKNKAGNPNNPPPKVVSGPREDNHLNPSQQKTADLIASAMSDGVVAGPAFANVAVQPPQPAPPQKEIPTAIR